jgi:N-terminal domain of toast_rack, DUF2154
MGQQFTSAARWAAMPSQLKRGHMNEMARYLVNISIIVGLIVMMAATAVFVRACEGPRTSVLRPDELYVEEMQSESKSVSLEGFRGPNTGMTFAHVKLKMRAGKLNLTGGADGLMEAHFSYNVPAWKPKVSYRPGYEEGQLTVRQGSTEGARLGGDAHNEWDISLNDEVPTDLVVEVGAGESDLDLDSLNLGGHPADRTDLTVETGAGDTTVDLTGDYTQSFDASIKGGVGEAMVLLPSRVGVRVNAQGLGKIDAKGLQRVDDSYVNDAYGESRVTLRVDATQGDFGEINLEVV